MCQKTWHGSPLRSDGATIVSASSGSCAALKTHRPQQASVEEKSGWSATFSMRWPRAYTSGCCWRRLSTYSSGVRSPIGSSVPSGLRVEGARGIGQAGDDLAADSGSACEPERKIGVDVCDLLERQPAAVAEPDADVRALRDDGVRGQLDVEGMEQPCGRAVIEHLHDEALVLVAKPQHRVAALAGGAPELRVTERRFS